MVSYHDALRAELQSGGAEGGGPERFHVGWRPAKSPARLADTDRDVVVVSAWMSAEVAARADAAQMTPIAIARRHELAELGVAHFEIDDTIRRHSEDQPVAIRLATGRFSKPGADAEMQNLLRQRAPLIGDDMAEAWVGRRLTGPAVEVTFVSTWRRFPDDRALDEAFWPDIALRYDQFAVEVYSPVGVE